MSLESGDETGFRNSNTRGGLRGGAVLRERSSLSGPEDVDPIFYRQIAGRPQQGGGGSAASRFFTQPANGASAAVSSRHLSFTQRGPSPSSSDRSSTTIAARAARSQYRPSAYGGASAAGSSSGVPSAAEVVASMGSSGRRPVHDERVGPAALSLVPDGNVQYGKNEVADNAKLVKTVGGFGSLYFNRSATNKFVFVAASGSTEIRGLKKKEDYIISGIKVFLKEGSSPAKKWIKANFDVDADSHDKGSKHSSSRGARGNPKPEVSVKPTERAQRQAIQLFDDTKTDDGYLTKMIDQVMILAKSNDFPLEIGGWRVTQSQDRRYDAEIIIDVKGVRGLHFYRVETSSRCPPVSLRQPSETPMAQPSVIIELDAKSSSENDEDVSDEDGSVDESPSDGDESTDTY